MNIHQAMKYIKQIDDKVNYIKQINKNTFIARIDTTGSKFIITSKDNTFSYLKYEISENIVKLKSGSDIDC